jgi:hypothetical protein
VLVSWSVKTFLLPSPCALSALSRSIQNTECTEQLSWPHRPYRLVFEHAIGWVGRENATTARFQTFQLVLASKRHSGLPLVLSTLPGGLTEAVAAVFVSGSWILNLASAFRHSPPHPPWSRYLR